MLTPLEAGLEKSVDFQKKLASNGVDMGFLIYIIDYVKGNFTRTLKSKYTFMHNMFYFVPF